MPVCQSGAGRRSREGVSKIDDAAARSEAILVPSPVAGPRKAEPADVMRPINHRQLINQQATMWSDGVQQRPESQQGAQSPEERDARGAQSPGGRPDFTGLRILAVHAHPDDESSKGAGAMAYYADHGARVMVVTCTGGERGSILNPGVEENPRSHWDLPGLRHREMAAAQQVLGVEHRWLGFMDSGLPEGEPLPPLPFGCFATLPLRTASAPLIRLVREFRPHVLLSYDENGGYPHPDHIMAHQVAVEAWRAAGDEQAYQEQGPAWSPLKLYYDRAFNVDRFRALHEALVERGLDSPFAERVARLAESEPEGALPVSRHETTTQIPVGEYIPRREDALRAHVSQVDPNGFFFAVPAEIQAEVWPWEDYRLIDSRVETSVPEGDFGAGIDAAAADAAAPAADDGAHAAGADAESGDVPGGVVTEGRERS